MHLDIRPYSPETDYSSIKQLYIQAGSFDPETDAPERLRRKISRDHQSMLVATEGQRVVGAVSFMEDETIAIFRRLVAEDRPDAVHIRESLLLAGEDILANRGYNEVHIEAPEQNAARRNEYLAHGFNEGNPYRWFWRRI